MRKYFLFILIASSLVATAQKIHVRASIDEFFAGVPLNQEYGEWVKYIYKDSNLKIDSVNSRGVYSSFKSGIKSFFSFNDSVTVKLLLQKIVYYDSLPEELTDSTSEIAIEAVFPDSKTGRKDAVKEFSALRKELRANYRHVDIGNYQFPIQVNNFSRGKNKNFPDCYLQQGYSDDLKFYFVMIVYIIPRKNAGLK